MYVYMICTNEQTACLLSGLFAVQPHPCLKYLGGNFTRPANPQLQPHLSRVFPTINNVALAVRISRLPFKHIWLIQDRKYRSIAPKTRILLGVGVMAYASIALVLSDKAEEKFGLVPSEKDKEELEKVIPKIIPIDKRER